MNQTDFLETAMAKYKKAVKKKFISEMNFIFSPKLILRVWFDHTIDQPKGAYCHRWNEVEDLGNETIFNKFDEFLCENSEDFPLILLALKKVLKHNSKMYMLIDHLEYKKGISITPTETFEYTFTVKEFCETVGIES